MSLSLTRAHHRFLGLQGPPLSQPDETHEALTAFTLHPEALRTIQQLLLAPGLLLSGPLYGHRWQGVLHTRLLAPGGYVWWLDPDVPLALDEHYTLGYGDAVQALCGSQVYWAGHWLVAAHRQWPTPEEQLAWLRQGQRDGLVDTVHPLLFMGWAEGRLRAEAMSLERGTNEVWTLEIQTDPGYRAPGEATL